MAVPVPVPDELPARQGPSVHTADRLRSMAFLNTAPRPAAAPTNQGLDPELCGHQQPGSDHGIAIGDDRLSGSALFDDVFTSSYAARLISSRNGVENLRMRTATVRIRLTALNVFNALRPRVH